MATTEILCRIDPSNKQPVVFLTDTIHNGKIKAWKGEGTKPEYVPLDYYKVTTPLSAADEQVLMERFKASTGKQDQVVVIRQRMPRTSRPIPNLLASSSSVLQQTAANGVAPAPTAAPTPAPQPPSVAQATPADVMQAIAALGQEFNQRLGQLATLLVAPDTAPSKKSARKTAAKKKGGTRKAAAKPV